MSLVETFSLEHLERMSDHRGLYEHAAGTVRRPEHGYCTDDNARLLVVTSREPDTGAAHHLSRLALGFVLEAFNIDGRCRNRMSRSGIWTDLGSTDDCWGRGLWGLGTAAVHHPDPHVRERALRGFDNGIRLRSRWPRAMAFASLGAAEVLTDCPDHTEAGELLDDTLELIGTIPAGDWAWPEPRLAYANASLAEAVIAAGAARGNRDGLDRGLTMLRWLLQHETSNGHLSVSGVGGRGPDDHGPMFDQQPIEVAAIADACWRAYSVTDDRTWLSGIAAAADWFQGDNDIGACMHDSESGGGYDGLEHDGVNRNQGAESTLAFISTMQRVRSAASAA